MKKEDLKTGMTLETKSGLFGKVLLETSRGNIIAGTREGIECFWFNFDQLSDNLKHINGSSDYDVIRIYEADFNIHAASVLVRGKLLWERKEEKPILILDGVEYSESTLRSLIKKATS